MRGKKIMRNRTILLGLLILTFGAATRTDAKEGSVLCLNHKGLLSACDVVVEDLKLRIAYKDRENQDLNMDIPGWNIRSLSLIEDTKRSKFRDQIRVEYVSDAKDKDAPVQTTLIDADKTEGMRIRLQLEVISRKELSTPSPQ